MLTPASNNTVRILVALLLTTGSGLGGCSDDDGGPTNNSDGSVSHSDEIPDACRTNCNEPSCGDAVVDIQHGETCDYGPDLPATATAREIKCGMRCGMRCNSTVDCMRIVNDLISYICYGVSRVSETSQTIGAKSSWHDGTSSCF